MRCDEIDSILKAEKAAFSAKSDIFRLSFDNAQLIQQYMSDTSFSGATQIFLNVIATGTYDSVFRLLQNVENGLATRCIISELPDTFGQPVPYFEDYTANEAALVRNKAEYMMQQAGEIACPLLNRYIADWLEGKRLEAIASDSRALDTLRRRSAVIGWRGGMMMFLLFGQVWTKAVADYALWLAEYTLQNQLRFFGDKFEQTVNDQLEGLGKQGKTKALLTQLPNQFTLTDLKTVRESNNQSINPNSLRVVLHRWETAGLIIADKETRTYKIVEPTQKRKKR